MRFIDPPNPAGSAIEKLLVQRRRLSEPRRLEQYLRQEGLDPSLAVPLGRAFSRFEEDNTFQFQQLVDELQRWANTHTHPGGGGGGGGDPGSPGWQEDILHSTSFTAHRTYLLDSQGHGPDLTGTGLSSQPPRHGWWRISNLSAMYAGNSETSNANATDKAAVYHRDTDTWLDLPPAPQRKLSPGTAYDVASGQYFFVGGRSNTGATAAAYAFDVGANLWKAIANYPLSGAIHPGMGAVLDGSLYSFGQESGTNYSSYRYDIATDTWFTIAPRPGSGITPKSIVVSGLIYVMSTTGFWRYSPSEDAYTTLAMTGASGDVIAMTGARGKVYASKGSALVEYTPETDTWATMPNASMSFTGLTPLGTP